MPVIGPKIRTVIFVPAALAERCAALASRHRASRSEVYRLAIEHGLKHVRPALKRLERTRPDSYRPARGGGLQPGTRSRPTDRAVVGEEGVHARLLDYGHSYLSVSPNAERDDVRVALATEAKLLQAPDAGLDNLLDDVLGELFSDEGSPQPADADNDAVLPPD
ncbi:MAG: hypothetical protein OXG72_20545 [Acidobacteria bacterium]|nr:hypothetical protein [Acidobacteriota bacterium]